MQELSTDEARDRLLNVDGAVVRMTVGLDHDDPVIELTNEDGMITSRSIAGWSEGVQEDVCEESSDFLRGYLSDRVKLEAIEPEVPEEETITLTITRAEAHALLIECLCCNTSEAGMNAWGSLKSKNGTAMREAGWV